MNKFCLTISLANPAHPLEVNSNCRRSKLQHPPIALLTTKNVTTTRQQPRQTLGKLPIRATVITTSTSRNYSSNDPFEPPWRQVHNRKPNQSKRHRAISLVASLYHRCNLLHSYREINTILAIPIVRTIIIIDNQLTAMLLQLAQVPHRAMQLSATTPRATLNHQQNQKATKMATSRAVNLHRVRTAAEAVGLQRLLIQLVAKQQQLVTTIIIDRKPTLIHKLETHPNR